MICCALEVLLRFKLTEVQENVPAALLLVQWEQVLRQEGQFMRDKVSSAAG